MFDTSIPYDHPNNIATGAGKAKIKTYLCPSNAAYQDDPEGYGQTDYMPIAYTDIDPTTGARCTLSGTCATYRVDAMLTLHNAVIGSGTASPPSITTVSSQNTALIIKKSGRKISAIGDGTSNTMGVVEDVGKVYEGFSPFMLANYKAYSGSGSPSPSGLRNNYRWAEPDSANGVSGPHKATGASSTQAKINNNASPKGGPPGCSWSLNNCGPNDEPFSFHSGGVNAVFGDGHVQFVRDSISPQVLRAVCTANGGEVQSIDN